MPDPRVGLTEARQPRGWSLIGETPDGTVHVLDHNLTLIEAGQRRDWLGAGSLPTTYRVVPDRPQGDA